MKQQILARGPRNRYTCLITIPPGVDSRASLVHEDGTEKLL